MGKYHGHDRQTGWRPDLHEYGDDGQIVEPSLQEERNAFVGDLDRATDKDTGLRQILASGAIEHTEPTNIEGEQ